MPQTIIEKIISEHSGDKVSAGNIAWMDLDVRAARDFAGANVVKNYRKHYGDESVADTDKTFFTFDCNVPANTIPYANNQHICRTFAREQGIRVFDVDAGIGSHVLMENGEILPGGTVINTDSHMNIAGAVGALGQGMGDTDTAFGFRTGKVWFEVPPTIRIELKGYPGGNAGAKDVILFVLGKLGSSGALGYAVEIYGEYIDKLELAGRITISSMGTEMGAIAIILPPSSDILDWCFKRSDTKAKGVFADNDAEYVESYTFDIEALEPQIACPPSPSNVKPVKEVAGTKIDSGFIGSCTNGRFEDFKGASDILYRERIAEGVMLRCVPATKEVWQEMLNEGLIGDLFESGAVISNCGCGGCASGQIGMTGKGEVQVSTSNRNFTGKQGAGDTYLASPLTVAASALNGEITDP
ncbi:MAG: homoaconitate hydratase family protein [bacterium]|nr:homoaconitate hydratase family protein [bacterium]